MTSQTIAPSVSYLEPIDSIGLKRSWLEHRCLLGLLSAKPSPNPWATARTSVAIAGELYRRLRNPSGTLRARDWVVGKFAQGILSGMPKVSIYDSYAVADAAYAYAGIALCHLSLNGDTPVFPSQRFPTEYALSYRDRLTVALLADAIVSVPHAVTEPDVLVKVAMSQTKAIARANHPPTIRNHWLVNLTMPWVARQAKLSVTPMHDAADFVVACAERIDTTEARALIVPIILELPDIDEVKPDDVVQFTQSLAQALAIARATHPQTDDYLSLLVLSELARHSQCRWNPEQQQQAAELAIRQASDYREITKQA